MKTLSLLQPWATLVVIGAKKIETRKWATGYRGTILIHASMGRAGKVLAGQAPFTKYIDNYEELPFGAIIGEATLVDIVKTEELDIATDRVNKLTLEERAFGDYTGRYAWLLEDAVLYSAFLPAKGQLGLWEYPDDLYEQERNRLI
ncbi:MAG: ASCH domain-containing protein [Sphingobacteriales bacterium]|nr:MAG: ASCH domain-containing protein [Sphingobacteriales bacterium]